MRTVFITDEAKQLMKNQYSLSIPDETGGILFGYYSEDLEAATITDVYNIEDSKEDSEALLEGKKDLNDFQHTCGVTVNIIWVSGILIRIPYKHEHAR